MRRELTTAMVLLARHWLKPDLRTVSARYRKDTERRMAALESVIQGASLRSASSHHRVNRTTLAAIVDKAFQLGSDGRHAGYLACIPYSVKRSTKKDLAPVMPSAGTAHSMEQLFAAHPDVKQRLEDYKGALPPGRLPPGFKRVLSEIRGLLVQRELQTFWPMNTKDKGRRAFARFVRRIRRQAIVDGAPSNSPIEMRSITRLHQLFALRPFDRVEFDAHRLDVKASMLVPDARGELIVVPISAIWILVIMDAASTACLAWKIVIGQAYSALDVAQCFASAKRRWEPRALIVPDMQYAPGSMMPSNISPSGPIPIGRLTAMDNAKAHKSKLPLDSWLQVHYGVLNFGPPHVPEIRPYIEQWFNRLELGAIREIPGGFRPDRESHKPTPTSAWSSNDHPIHFQALDDLMDVIITGHNTSPIPARNNRTPIEIITNYVDGDDYWIPPPFDEQRAKELTTICVDVIIKGSKKKNKPVHIQYLQVNYRCDEWVHAWEMVGRSFKARVDLEDLRTILLVDKSSKIVCTMHAAEPWRLCRHDVTTRRRILALCRSGELEIRGATCAITAYAAYTAMAAQNRSAAADQLARLIQLLPASAGITEAPANIPAATGARQLPLTGSVSFSDLEEFT